MTTYLLPMKESFALIFTQVVSLPGYVAHDTTLFGVGVGLGVLVSMPLTLRYSVLGLRISFKFFQKIKVHIN